MINMHNPISDVDMVIFGSMNIEDMTEEEVKLNFITPAIVQKGWDKSQIFMERSITKGQVHIDQGTQQPFIDSSKIVKPDYYLMSKSGIVLAIVEAKDAKHAVSDGLQQAKRYHEYLDAPFVYSSNGLGFEEYDYLTGEERSFGMQSFPTEEELWQRYLDGKDVESSSPLSVPFYFQMGGKTPRYYQMVAVNRILEAVERGQKRILVAMATGTGKTMVAMQTIYKLLESKRARKILYLVDRNNLADQTIANDFKVFSNVIEKFNNRKISNKNSIVLGLYQQFVGSDGKSDHYKEFDPSYFDVIFVDECHRGSAKMDSEWHAILDYFDSAIQIGMTATPKEDKEVSTSLYFGKPVYMYSYRQGVDDGFLAPFVLESVTTSIDDEWYPEEGITDQNGNQLDGPYNRRDYDLHVMVDDRTRTVAKKVLEVVNRVDPYAKTIVFCRTIPHAEAMRIALTDLCPERMKEDDRYVVRITGDSGKEYLDDFNDKNSRYPVIVTTSELLTTGSDCFMTKVVAIDKTVNSATEFKQIIGRGSRLDTQRNKWFFVLVDFRDNARHFLDDDWDYFPPAWVGPHGNPPGGNGRGGGGGKTTPREKIYVRGKVNVDIYDDFIGVYGPEGFSKDNIIEFSKQKLRMDCPAIADFIKKWNSEDSKRKVIEDLESEGVLIENLLDYYPNEDLDIFDILCSIAYGSDLITRRERADRVRSTDLLDKYSSVARQILETLLDKYAESSENDITDKKILTLPDFRMFGSLPRIMNTFGGKEQYEAAVRELQNAIYA